jgi:hypothetical protein
VGVNSKWSLWSDDSVLCIGCQSSVLSIGSIGSVLFSRRTHATA